ncbi:MAG: hypothetical protein P8Y14_17710 [Anaerolineales bacterium]
MIKWTKLRLHGFLKVTIKCNCEYSHTADGADQCFSDLIFSLTPHFPSAVKPSLAKTALQLLTPFNAERRAPGNGHQYPYSNLQLLRKPSIFNLPTSNRLDNLPAFRSSTLPAFDWAWSVDCVGYAPIEPLPLVKELARVVKPGGRVAILAWSSEKLLPGYPVLEAHLNATSSGIAPFVRGKKPELHFTRALGWLRDPKKHTPPGTLLLSRRVGLRGGFAGSHRRVEQGLRCWNNSGILYTIFKMPSNPLQTGTISYSQSKRHRI